jgi:hypothetical protein
MIDSLIPQIESLQAHGAVVLLKWDCTRTRARCTVVTRQDTDYVWRKDCDDIASTLVVALVDYKAKHDRYVNAPQSAISCCSRVTGLV